MSRSLSDLEARLILRLEWEKQPVVSIEETMRILDCSYGHARQVLHRLARRRWLMPLTPGTYELIPAERGEHAFPDTNPPFIGSTLVEPCYFSYATASFFHGLSTQASATVYVATTVRTRSRTYLVRGKEYRLVLQPADKFFGSVEVDAYGSRVHMAEPEKTVVDALDWPEYAGDIPEITGMLQRGEGRLNRPKLADIGVWDFLKPVLDNRPLLCYNVTASGMSRDASHSGALSLKPQSLFFGCKARRRRLASCTCATLTNPVRPTSPETPLILFWLAFPYQSGTGKNATKP